MELLAGDDVPSSIVLTPATEDPDIAAHWLARFGAGFEPDEVVRRLELRGDLFAPVLTMQQRST